MSTDQAPSPSYDSKEVEVLDFDVLEEYWNEYDLEDNSRLRARLIVTRVALRPGTPVGQFDLSFQTILMITAPPNQRGAPGPPVSPEEINVSPEDIASGRKIPVRPLTNNEPWNIYRVEKTTDVFQAKLVVSAVYRIKERYDQFGEPAYVITSGPVVAPLAKGYVKLEPKGKRELKMERRKHRN